MSLFIYKVISFAANYLLNNVRVHIKYAAKPRGDIIYVPLQISYGSRIIKFRILRKGANTIYL